MGNDTTWTKQAEPGSRLTYQVYKFIYQIQYHGPYTAEDLAHDLGVNRRTAVRHLRELWSLDLIHICNWDRAYHWPIPVFAWGNRHDKPRPMAKPPDERGRRYRERQKMKLASI